MNRKTQNIINCLLKFKSIAKSDMFAGDLYTVQHANMCYYFGLINKVLDVVMQKEINIASFKLNLLILCNYDYLLNKIKKESRSYLKELQNLKNIYFNEV